MRKTSSFDNEKKFLESYDKNFNKIYNFILTSVLNKELAEDLTGNTFLKAYKYIKKKNNYIENLNAWLYKIAVNELLLHYRRKKIVKFTSLDDQQDEYGETLTDKNNTSVDQFVDFLAVKQLINQLKPLDRVIIEMYYFEHKTYEEMSDVLGITINNLRVKIHRLLKKIFSMLDD